MKVLTVTCLLINLTFCTIKDFSTPITTLKTLQHAIGTKNWKLASLCLTDEIRTENQRYLDTKDLFYSDYWTETRTVQVLMGPIPIISKNARFTIKKLDNQDALIEISYPNPVDKDMRIQQINLKKNVKNEWRVAEIYGKIKGIKNAT